MDDRAKEFRILVGTIGYDLKGEEVINGIEFGNHGEQVMISTVTGLEAPPIRNNTGDWSGRDGGFMSSQLYSARVITINGFYWDKNYACDWDSIERNDFPYSVREKLANYIKIRQRYDLFIHFMSGRTYHTWGYMIDFKMDYEFVRNGEYQITFYCPDYALNLAEIYGDPESIWRRAELHKEIFGGHLVPEDLPVLFEEGQHPTEIEYEGLIPCYPVINLKGPSTNPIFLNTATNKYLKMGTDDDPFVMQAGQNLTIDMNNRQVLLNGKSVSMSIDPNSDWWYLTQGKNKIYMLSSGNNDTPVAEIRWTESYQGV